MLYSARKFAKNEKNIRWIESSQEQFRPVPTSCRTMELILYSSWVRDIQTDTNHPASKVINTLFRATPTSAHHNSPQPRPSRLLNDTCQVERARMCYWLLQFWHLQDQITTLVPDWIRRYEWTIFPRPGGDSPWTGISQFHRLCYLAVMEEDRWPTALETVPSTGYSPDESGSTFSLATYTERRHTSAIQD